MIANAHKLLLIFFLTFSMSLSASNSLAQEISPSGRLSPIQKGETAPFSGYVIDKAMEKSMRSKVETEKRKNVLLSDLRVVQDKRIAFYQETSENAYKELRTQRVKTTIYTLGGFTLGIGLSALTIYVMKGAMK